MKLKASYTPRRASLTRWLSGAPEYILDVFYSPKESNPYTILFGGSLVGHRRNSQRGGHARTAMKRFSISKTTPAAPWCKPRWVTMTPRPNSPASHNMRGEFLTRKEARDEIKRVKELLKSTP